MTLPHNQAMIIRAAALSKRVMGCILLSFLACTFRIVGAKMRKNTTGKNHNKTNNVTGKPSRARKVCRLINSRTMNGRIRMRLTIAGNLTVAKTFFM
jgi:hypothetical protein